MSAGSAIEWRLSALRRRVERSRALAPAGGPSAPPPARPALLSRALRLALRPHALARKLLELRDRGLIVGSGLFDAGYYARRNPRAALDPLGHFLREGDAARLSPHPAFDGAFYSRGLLHYLRGGWRDGRDPHPLFPGALYLEAFPEARGGDPLRHFLRSIPPLVLPARAMAAEGRTALVVDDDKLAADLGALGFDVTAAARQGAAALLEARPFALVALAGLRAARDLTDAVRAQGAPALIFALPAPADFERLSPEEAAAARALLFELARLADAALAADPRERALLAAGAPDAIACSTLEQALALIG
jgi:hypothetical protein